MHLRKIYIPFLFLILIMTILPKIATAQINVKVGYSAGYTNPKVYNNIIKQFNDNNPWLDKSMGKLAVLHGLHLGFRYKISNFGFELSWANKYGQKTSSGILPNTTDTTFERELNLRMNELSFAYENYIGPIILGASIDGIMYNFKTKVTGTDGRYPIGAKQYGLASTFTLGISLEANDRMSVCIKPYVQMPWTMINLRSVDLELNENNSLPPETDYEQRFLNFGVMLIFYNGQTWD